MPSSAATFLASLCSARLTRLVGLRRLIFVGGLLIGAGAATIGLFHDHPWQIYLAGATAGVGTGMVFAALANAVLVAVPAEQSGTAIGMNANLRTIGGTIGIAVMTTLVTARLQSNGYRRRAATSPGTSSLLVRPSSPRWWPC